MRCLGLLPVLAIVALLHGCASTNGPAPGQLNRFAQRLEQYAADHQLIDLRYWVSTPTRGPDAQGRYVPAPKEIWVIVELPASSTDDQLADCIRTV